MEKMYTDENDEIEIDLRELLFEFKRKWWIILLSVMAGALIVGAWSMFLIVPQYKSEAKLYVLSKETTLTSLADLQIGSQLTQDYKVLVGSRPVMEGVISHLKLNLTYEELVKKLTVENPQNTRILSLIVEDADPYMAKAIADDIANTASDYIGEIMEMIPPKLIEDGVVAAKQSSPNVLKNTLIGAFVALILVCGLIAMRIVLNDTVRTEEDVEKYLGLPVLAVIPKKGDDRKKDSEKKDGEKAVSGGTRRRQKQRTRGEKSNSENINEKADEKTYEKTYEEINNKGSERSNKRNDGINNVKRGKA